MEKERVINSQEHNEELSYEKPMLESLGTWVVNTTQISLPPGEP